MRLRIGFTISTLFRIANVAIARVRHRQQASVTLAAKAFVIITLATADVILTDKFERFGIVLSKGRRLNLADRSNSNVVNA